MQIEDDQRKVTKLAHHRVEPRQLGWIERPHRRGLDPLPQKRDAGGVGPHRAIGCGAGTLREDIVLCVNPGETVSTEFASRQVDTRERRSSFSHWRPDGPR